jgi:hypothetical protein
MSNVRQNLIGDFACNVLGLPIAMACYTDPEAFAVATHRLGGDRYQLRDQIFGSPVWDQEDGGVDPIVTIHLPVLGGCR